MLFIIEQSAREQKKKNNYNRIKNFILIIISKDKVNKKKFPIFL